MSISLDFTNMLSTAQTLIEGLWPVFVIPLGFSLALALIGWIYKKVTEGIHV